MNYNNFFNSSIKSTFSQPKPPLDVGFLPKCPYAAVCLYTGYFNPNFSLIFVGLESTNSSNFCGGFSSST